MFFDYIKNSVMNVSRTMMVTKIMVKLSLFIIILAIQIPVACTSQNTSFLIALLVLTLMYAICFSAKTIMNINTTPTQNQLNIEFGFDVARYIFLLLGALFTLITAIACFDGDRVISMLSLAMAIIEVGVVYIYSVVRMISWYFKYQTKKDIQEFKKGFQETYPLFKNMEENKRIDK